MGHVDAMTLDIVAMLFDYILDDRNIPDAMKALIGRLQIPVLKVAMLDKTFFSQKNAPCPQVPRYAWQMLRLAGMMKKAIREALQESRRSGSAHPERV